MPGLALAAAVTPGCPARSRAGRVEPGLGAGRDVDEGGEGARAGQRRGAGGRPGEVAGDPERLGVDEATVAADPPLVGDRAGSHRLAHGGAAEDEGLDRGQAGVAGEIDLEAAFEPRGVEEDRLLRQPVEPGAGPEVEAGLDPGGAARRAVDALGRLGGGGERGAGPDREAPVEAVAAGDAAGGVDEHRPRGSAQGCAAGSPWRSPPGTAGRAGRARPAATRRLRRGRGRAGVGSGAGSMCIAGDRARGALRMQRADWLRAGKRRCGARKSARTRLDFTV